MAVDLKKTNVAIVGLGAVGGVAALPLAQAGLDVVGLEAGTWLTRRDFSPDELRSGAESESRDPDLARDRLVAHRPERQHSPDAERRRRHVAALLGAELAAQRVGLQ